MIAVLILDTRYHCARKQILLLVPDHTRARAIVRSAEEAYSLRRSHIWHPYEFEHVAIPFEIDVAPYDAHGVIQKQYEVILKTTDTRGERATDESNTA